MREPESLLRERVSYPHGVWSLMWEILFFVLWLMRESLFCERVSQFANAELLCGWSCEACEWMLQEPYYERRRLWITRRRSYRLVQFVLIDWCCFHYYTWNSLVALLEALFAWYVLISWGPKAFWKFLSLSKISKSISPTIGSQNSTHFLFVDADASSRHWQINGTKSQTHWHCINTVILQMRFGSPNWSRGFDKPFSTM